MYTVPTKKLMILNILDILNKYTDENHKLSQKEIQDKLASEYQMTVDRKSVKRNLMDLIDCGYQIEYTEILRKNKKGEEESILTDWYIVRKFSDAELRLIIDSLLFSKNIPQKQCRSLINKVSELSNEYFSAKFRHITNLPADLPTNKQLFYTIEVLDEAIEHKKQVSFTYSGFGTDGKLHPRLDNDGTPHKYVVNPFQMVASNGRYYLLCTNLDYDNVVNYRIDRITDITMLEESFAKNKNVVKAKDTLILPKHMAEHIYMFSGPGEYVTFKAKSYLINDIIDWFGNSVRFSDETEEDVTCTVKVNLHAMCYWALQYCAHVTVLSPESLVNDIKNELKTAMAEYK
ncbi:MAG: WYL domain-containing protein [Eubacteriales bacterium]|nr:WYL domain-containing protein [Eubacteriales bacterium]